MSILGRIRGRVNMVECENRFTEFKQCQKRLAINYIYCKSMYTNIYTSQCLFKKVFGQAHGLGLFIFSLFYRSIDN